MTISIARRSFLKRASSAAFLATPLGITASLNQMAQAATGGAGYKALVCVYLQGGNDHGNTITPYDNANYKAYQTLRPSVAIAQSALTATALTATKNTVLNSAGASCTFALAPELAPLLPLYNAGQLAIQLNVGTLVQPTTAAQYKANPDASTLPYQLMSHQAQTAEWQADQSPAGTTGWGGRMADPFVSQNGSLSVLSSMNASSLGAPLMSLGASATPYTCGSTAKIPAISAIVNGSLFGSSAAASTLQSLLTATSADPFRNTYSGLVSTALTTQATVNSALGSAPSLTSNFPNQTVLDTQLQQVARLISIGPGLGLTRQVFFCGARWIRQPRRPDDRPSSAVNASGQRTFRVLQRPGLAGHAKPGDDVHAVRIRPCHAVQCRRIRPWLGQPPHDSGGCREGNADLRHSTGHCQRRSR